MWVVGAAIHRMLREALSTLERIEAGAMQLLPADKGVKGTESSPSTSKDELRLSKTRRSRL